MMILAMKYCR